MADLAGRLKVSQSWAIGLLESLWHWAGEFCPDGAIRYPADVVADAVWWPRGDAHRLVKALVDAKWLDPSPEGWLIHDWPHHCEDSVHRRLASERRLFADGSIPKFRALDSKDRPAAEAYYRAIRATTVETPRPTRGDSTAEAPQIIDSTPPLGGRGDSTDSPRVGCGVFVGPLPLPLPLPVPSPSPNARARSPSAQTGSPESQDGWRDRLWAEFRKLYPKRGKVNPHLDAQLLISGVNTEAEAESVITALRAWVACEDWRGGFVEKASTWISGRMWEVEPPPPKPQRGRRSALDEMEGT